MVAAPSASLPPLLLWITGAAATTSLSREGRFAKELEAPGGQGEDQDDENTQNEPGEKAPSTTDFLKEIKLRDALYDSVWCKRYQAFTNFGLERACS
jgi:hypothetical protein